MSEKQELIKRMLEMQNEFVELEHKQGVSGKDYFNTDEDSFLAKYRKEYAEIADKVVNLAHAEKGSIRD